MIDCETKRKVKEDTEIWARATGRVELSFTGMRRRKTGPSAWNILSLRCLADTQAEIHGWVERSESSGLDRNLDVPTTQTVSPGDWMIWKQTNEDELFKVAREYLEANKILQTGQISLLTASGVTVIEWWKDCIRIMFLKS